MYNHNIPSIHNFCTFYPNRWILGNAHDIEEVERFHSTNQGYSMFELYWIAIFSPPYTQAAGGKLLTRSEAVYLVFCNLQVKVELHGNSEFWNFLHTTLYQTHSWRSQRYDFPSILQNLTIYCQFDCILLKYYNPTEVIIWGITSVQLLDCLHVISQLSVITTCSNSLQNHLCTSRYPDKFHMITKSTRQWFNPFLM